MTRPLLTLTGRAGLSLAAAATALSTVPWRTAAREADDWFDGDEVVEERLAEGVWEWIDAGVTRGQFATGSQHFDDEWVFGTCFMASLGFAQLALAHPDDPRWAERTHRSVDCLLSVEAQAFDRRKYGLRAGSADVDEILRSPRGHAAYVGYTALALSMERRVDPDGPRAALHDRFAASFARRVALDPTGIAETYPRERYPVDNAMGIAALRLRADTLGEPVPEVVDTWTRHVRDTYLDPNTGLLVQYVPPDGAATHPARGSGTLLAAYALTLAGDPLGADLYRAARTWLYGEIAGYGMMREYGPGESGAGDIDSGPIVLGYGVSPTGFALGPARATGDRGTFRHLFATSWLFGAPADLERPGGVTARHYAAGGPLGDAILLAMLTASAPEPPRAPDVPRGATVREGS